MKKVKLTIFIVIIAILFTNIGIYANEKNELIDADGNNKADKYYYKTVVEPSGNDPWEFTITPSEASSVNNYSSAIKLVVNLITCYDKSGLLNWFVDNYYNAPYSCVGDYVVTKYKVRRVRVSRLTGKETTIRRGFKVNAVLNGQYDIYSATFWYK